MAEKTSPTGKPRVPASWVPFINTLMALAFIAGSTCAVAFSLVHWSVALCAAVFTAGLWLLGNSPGLRFPGSPMALLLASGLLLSGCATFKADAGRFFKLTASCALGAATNEGRVLIGELDTATKRGAVDWRAKGEQLGWDALACALEALAGVVQNRLELALAPEQMGWAPDPDVAALVEQLHRVREGMEQAEARGEQ